MPDNPGKTLLEKARSKMVSQMIELDMPATREKFKGLFNSENHAGKDKNINIDDILTYVDAYNTGSDPIYLRNLMNEENRYYDNLSDDLKKKHIDNWDPSIYSEVEAKQKNEDREEKEEKEEDEEEEAPAGEEIADAEAEAEKNIEGTITSYINELHNESEKLDIFFENNGFYPKREEVSDNTLAKNIMSTINTAINVGNQIFASDIIVDKDGKETTILADAALRDQKARATKAEAKAKETQEALNKAKLAAKSDPSPANNEKVKQLEKESQEAAKAAKTVKETNAADAATTSQKTTTDNVGKQPTTKGIISTNEDPERNPQWLGQKLEDFAEGNPTESLISTSTNTISKGSNDKSSSSNEKPIGRQTPYERYSYLTVIAKDDKLKASAFAQIAESIATRIIKEFIKKELDKPSKNDRLLTNSLTKLFNNKGIKIQINKDTIDELLPNLQALAYLYQIGRSDTSTSIIKDVVEKAIKDNSISGDVIKQTERALNLITQEQDINRQQPRKLN